MTLRALIAGYYGAGNAGDEWILEALIGALHSRDPQAEVRVLLYDPPATRRRHGVEAVGWGELDALAGAVRWSSLVIAGGGGLLAGLLGLRSAGHSQRPPGRHRRLRHADYPGAPAWPPKRSARSGRRAAAGPVQPGRRTGLGSDGRGRFST